MYRVLITTQGHGHVHNVHSVVVECTTEDAAKEVVGTVNGQTLDGYDQKAILLFVPSRRSW